MSRFPLITLQPVADTRNSWVALMLELTPPDGASILKVFGEIGLAQALGPLPCVLSLPDLDAVPATPPAEHVMLRLPAALCCDPAQAEALQTLHAKGYRLMASGVPALGQMPAGGVEGLAVPCPGHGIPVGLMDWLKKLPGPHLALGMGNSSCPGTCHFQWIAAAALETAHPPGPGHKAVDAPNRVLLLELLTKVAKDADSHDIEATIKRDPQLSYYLLKLVNSVGFALTTKITSFNQAITLLGRRQLQRWLQLLLYARTREGDKANPLLPRAAMRAGLCEALCRVKGGDHATQDRAFMTGMFSLLDELFGTPIGEILGPLNLAEDVMTALTQRGGPLGPLLRSVVAGEGAGGETLAASLAEAGIGHEDWARCLVSACHWAVQVSCEA